MSLFKVYRCICVCSPKGNQLDDYHYHGVIYIRYEYVTRVGNSCVTAAVKQVVVLYLWIKYKVIY